jgi:YnbE-like lipoprotein
MLKNAAKVVHGGFTRLDPCYVLGQRAVRPVKEKPMRHDLWIVFGLAGLIVAGCTPTVRVEVPDKPIEINLNINMKIEQNIRFKLERELDRAAQANPGIF